MTGFNPVGNTANITAQGRGPAFQPVQSKAVTYPARPTLNPQPGQGGGMGGSLAPPGALGSTIDPQGMGQMGAFGMGPGGAPGAPGEVPGMGMETPGMGPASTAGLLGEEKDRVMPGGGDGTTPEGMGAFGSMGSPVGSPGGLKPASPISGASGFGNGVAGRGVRGAFGGGASGFGRR